MKKTSETYLQNRAKVLEFLYRARETSRIEISNETQLTPASITHIIADLIEENKVEETGDEIRDIKGSGRSRKLLTIHKSNRFFIGLEINMKGIFLSVTNAIGEVQSNYKIADSEYAIEEINETILSLIQKALNDYQKNRITYIGIAIPGHFDSDQHTIISNNMRWRYFNLKEINKKLSIPIVIENNIECMALSEYLFDSKNSPENFLFFHVGHGLFCSFFQGDKIERRENYYIGEIGHSVVDIHGPKCECGKKGCLQTYISDSWLLKNAQFLYRHSKTSIIRSLVDSPDKITLEVLAQGYKLQDNYLMTQIDSGLTFLATSIANTLILHDANKIYINSELLKYNDFKQMLIDQIQDQLNFIPTKRNLEIEVLAFDEYRGAIGACALAALIGFIGYSKF